MTTVGDNETDDLAAAIAGIHVGRLEDFVARRDELARSLRAAGRREDARTVKAIRKPRRLAWALDVVSFEEPAKVDDVANAVAATMKAQSGDGDLRASLASLRDSVHDLAVTAVRLGESRDQLFDIAELASAIMAVIGSRDAFESLRESRLVDIPEGGGLDLLTGPGTGEVPTGPASPPPAEDRTEPDAAALEAVRRAERIAEKARQQLETAERELEQAAAVATEAEHRLEQARTEAEAARTAVTGARTALDEARERAREADDDLARAREAAGTN